MGGKGSGNNPKDNRIQTLGWVIHNSRHIHGSCTYTGGPLFYVFLGISAKHLHHHSFFFFKSSWDILLHHLFEIFWCDGINAPSNTFCYISWILKYFLIYFQFWGKFFSYWFLQWRIGHRVASFISRKVFFFISWH